ncbi:TonB-dependent receptor [Caulobacter sp. 17J65-9]|uniref:TonB-dependent receptor n=1 Tax=Caulobacter sp. 17J65-9 TaxID=2709382 RepID=UPI0013CD240C|nr:TonB-dependent receptor [Caulobacter sp. 17J65-9]NEX91381.1 TonB-dependent receptor [Caulobacter sp. 17J65-9]
MKIRHWRLLAGASTLALVVGTAASAYAQAQPEDNNSVEEIVVTAQKREQALQDVPISVQALTSETLQEAGVVDMKSVSNIVPSLKTQESFQPVAQAYRIRGIGSEPSIPTFEPEVGLFIDGVYMPRSGLGVGDLVDVARVEVLSGPQSTLYGKNVNAGVINVVTEAPSHDWEGSLAATVSQFQGGNNAMAYRLAGSVSGPLSDKVRVRLTGVNYDQDHTYHNLVPGVGDANDMHRYAIRGEVALDLGEKTTLRVAAARSEIYDTDAINPEIFIQPTSSYPSGPGDNSIYILQHSPLAGLFGVSPCANTDTRDRVICTTDPTHTNSFNNMVSATLTSEIGGLDFTSITAWSNYKSQTTTKDVAQAQFPLLTYFDTQAGETISEELRLASPVSDTFEWQVGATFMVNDFNRGNEGKTPTFVLAAAAPYVPLPGAPGGFVLGTPGDKGFLDSDSSSTYYAAFGQATWHVTDQINLSGGLRWQHEEKEASVHNRSVVTPRAAPQGSLNLITFLLTPTGVNGDVAIPDMDNFVGNVTADYHPNNDTMFYATYSRGAKSGGGNIGFGNAPLSARPFKPETVDNYEIGAKLDLLDKRVRLSTAAFHTVYEDYQNAGFLGAQFQVNNAEEVVVDGVEANGAFVLGHGFHLTASATYLDSRYEKYTGGACHAPWPQAPAPQPANCDLSGKPLPIAPNWSTSIGLDYAHSVAWGEVYARGDWAWSSEYFTNTNLDPRLVQPSYSLFNARLGVRAGDGYDISVFANNLLNESVVVQDAVTTLFGKDPSYQRFLAPPREIGVTLRKEF